jgi:alginate O-acetyltransferase complex protein AlgI
MLFPTIDFAVFFVLVFLGHWLLNPNPRVWKWFMIGASYVFYGWWDWHFVILLVGVSVLAQVGAKAVASQADPRRRLVVNGIAVGSALLPLLYFKYYGFVSLNLTNALGSVGVERALPLVSILLPVGISFFTFMAISYIVDVYRGDTEVASWTDVFLYLSFFPHLVAGPIVRPGELIPQLDIRRDPRHVDVAGAMWLIAGGLFKKVVIASFLSAEIVDPVFGDPSRHSAIDAFFAIVGFAVVIYADFSGYTDIAIGIAKLLGFRFPENFDRPYSARSVQEFWRRWHMTLSRWLRDYLYISLGGNRRGTTRTYVNLFLTMLLGGLWHGAAWTFVVWGAYYGVLLSVHHWRADRRKAVGTEAPPDTPALVWGQRAATFALVCVGWVFFRSDSLATAFELLGRFLTGWSTPTTLVTPVVVGAIVLMLGLQFAPREPGRAIERRFAELAPVPMGLILGAVLLVIVILGPQGVAPFIYFQF